MKRELVLRKGYQEIAQDDALVKFIYARNAGIRVKFLLSLPANGGKTEVSISVINELFKIYPNIKVLILTHNTNVLKTNYVNRLNGLNLLFTYSTNLSDNSQVHITIPQNERSIIGHYDLVIIDEGHDNYLAEQEQRIINRVNPTMDLILTATPAKLILKGSFDMHIVGAIDIDDEFSAKVNLELVAADGCNWSDSNYNADENLIGDYNYTLDDTKRTLDSILQKLLERIKSRVSAEEFNLPSRWSLFKKDVKNKIKEVLSWVETFDEIGKSILVCDTIKHANLVYKVLKENNVNVLISHSECDENSEVIDNFQNNEDGILIVVDRCRIGYNDVHLKNLIDMSGTRNPNLIYQMMMRVSRGDQSMEKYYIKVTPKNLIDMGVTEIYVNAAINLMDTEFLKVFNGRNLNEMEIPILIRPRRPRPDGIDGIVDDDDDDDNVIDRPRNRLPVYINDLAKTLKDVKYDLTKPVSIYKKVTVIEAKNIMRGVKTVVKSTYKKKTYEELIAAARLVQFANEEA